MEQEEKGRIQATLRPIVHTSRGFYLLVWVLVAANLWLLYNFFLQLREGHIVTGLGSQGAVWGIFPANVVNLIGISHVGIAISAVVRLLNLERYKPLARIAELVTLTALVTAVINIGLDVGRPDRFIINVFWYGRWHSPFVWSMTVITTYLLASLVYLYLAMRRDLAILARVSPRRRGLYRFLALGYADTDEERRNHDRTITPLAVIILPIMVSVHSVYGYIFGLQAGRPGWFNPFQAPYFVLGAVVSGFSAIIIIAALLRRVYRWEEQLPARMFKGLGTFLAGVTWVYLYFLFSEYLTLQYISPSAELRVASDVLFGRFAWYFWPAIGVGMLVPFGLLLIQTASRRMCSIKLTVFAAVLINLAMWVFRYLIVVPSFYNQLLPYRVAPYAPTTVEWSMMLGTYAFGALFYVFLVKLLPVLELPRDYAFPKEVAVPAPVFALPAATKRALVTATVGLGAMLIGLGIAFREYGPYSKQVVLGLDVTSPSFVPASAIWVVGIVLLVTIPLQVCIIRSRRTTARK